MKRTTRLSLAVLALPLALFGCDDGTTVPPTTPPSPAAADAHDHADHAGHDHAEATEQAVADTTATAEEALAPASETAAEATADAQAAADSATSQARTLLDQAIQYIKENRLDLADKAITQLEGMDLPASMADQVASARSMLDAKKTMDGANNAAGTLKGMLNQ